MKLCLGRSTQPFPWHLPAHLFQDVLDKRIKILHPVPKRGNLDWKHCESMIKIQTEGSLRPYARSQLLKRLVRRRDHSHVHSDGLVVAYPLQLSALKEAQHLGLERHRHLTNLVQEERPSMSRFDSSRP